MASPGSQDRGLGLGDAISTAERGFSLATGGAGKLGSAVLSGSLNSAAATGLGATVNAAGLAAQFGAASAVPAGAELAGLVIAGPGQAAIAGGAGLGTTLFAAAPYAAAALFAAGVAMKMFSKDSVGANAGGRLTLDGGDGYFSIGPVNSDNGGEDGIPWVEGQLEFARDTLNRVIDERGLNLVGVGTGDLDFSVKAGGPKVGTRTGPDLVADLLRDKRLGGLTDDEIAEAMGSPGPDALLASIMGQGVFGDLNHTMSDQGLAGIAAAASLTGRAMINLKAPPPARATPTVALPKPFAEYMA